MNPTTLLVVGGGLGLVLLVLGVVVSLVGSRSVVEERLGRYAESGAGLGATQAAAEAKPRLGQVVADFLNRLGEGTDLFDSISRQLARADLKFRPAEYLLLIAISAAVCGLIGTVIGKSLIFGIGSAIVGAFLPQIYVKRAQRARLKQFDNQLGDMLNLMVNGLRAGYSTLQAMEAVSRELPAPISDEFRRVVQEMQLGLPMEEALQHLLRRINSEDLDLVVTAINVQREVGGNLAEILDVISYTIRERVRIKGEIAALTAQGRITAWVISLLPVALVGILFLANRQYIMQFFNPETRACGLPMIILAGLMIVSGFYAVQRIVAIDI
ncbi:MAG: type II secretion system F family protein [Chloroflexota bacterium]